MTDQTQSQAPILSAELAERAAFEKWYEGRHDAVDFLQRDDGQYDDWDIALQWNAWQARAAAPAIVAQEQEQPIAWMNPDESCVMDAFLWARDSQSPRYCVPVYTAISAQGERETKQKQKLPMTKVNDVTVKLYEQKKGA